MKELFEALLAALRRGETAALCTILGASGSAPRGAGAKMAVFADGSTIGTVGGGAVELRTIEMAKEAILRKKSLIHGFLLVKNQIEDLGMICGGNVTIYIQILKPENADIISFLEEVCELFGKNENSWLLYELCGGEVALMDIYTKARGLRRMTLDDAALAKLLTSQPVYQAGEPAYYAEPVVLAGTAYIFGGGHVGAALAPVLHYVGFRVAVFDNRPDFATPEHYPDADEVIFGQYQDFSPWITLQPEDYVTIMTPGHQADREVLLQALRSPAAYIGCIGSRSKIAGTRAWLAEHGIPDEAWERVHAPIGIPLGGRTPEEIAVSIAAEMIRHRAEHMANRR